MNNTKQQKPLAIVGGLALMVSGYGQLHTNEPDPSNPAKSLTPYTTIDLNAVRAMVDNPQRVDKAQAQWLIPSTLLSRSFREQKERGKYWLLWADVDKNPQGIDAVENALIRAIGFVDYEIYTTASATKDNMKCRVLILLVSALDYDKWVICQELLNGILEDAGIEPDKASERSAQLCYLPNRGECYENLSSRNNTPFAPNTAWAKLINERKKELISQAQELEAEKQAAMERKAARSTFNGVSLIDAFNDAYTVQDILIQSGYEQRGNTFKHPNSSGSFSASVKDGRVHALSTNDPLYSDLGAHDAFSAFTVLFHGGNETKATMDAGDNWLAIGGVSFNKHNQIEYATQHNTMAKEKESDDVIDDLELSHDYPIFNDSDFYGIAGDVARLASQDSEAAPVAVYYSFLTAAAAMIGRYKYLQVGETRHYARTFCAVVGASSRARKGTSFKPVERIIKETEKLLNHQHSLVIKNGGLSSAEGLIFAVRDEAEETDKQGNPIHNGVDDKRMLIVEEELGSVFKVMQREGNTLSSTLRTAWDGGDMSTMTKSNRLASTDPYINILGHITQFELNALISKNDMNNGMANRILWACVRRTKKIAFPKRMGDEPVNEITQRLSKAFSVAMMDGGFKVGGHGTSGQHSEISLNDEARKFWDVKYHEISVDRYGVLGSVTSRSEAQVLRLALLFCLLDCVTMITVDHMKAAISVIEYSVKSAEFIFTVPTEDTSDAQKLLTALSTKPLTQSEVSRVFSGNKPRKELVELLTELQTTNKIRKQKVEGSKAIMWELIR